MISTVKKRIITFQPEAASSFLLLIRHGLNLLICSGFNPIFLVHRFRYQLRFVSTINIKVTKSAA
jgi:hypothetical protein